MRKFSLNQVKLACHKAVSGLAIRRVGKETYELCGPYAETMNAKEFETVSDMLKEKQVSLACAELGITHWPMHCHILLTVKDGVPLETAVIDHLRYRIAEEAT